MSAVCDAEEVTSFVLSVRSDFSCFFMFLHPVLLFSVYDSISIHFVFLYKISEQVYCSQSNRMSSSLIKIDRVNCFIEHSDYDCKIRPHGFRIYRPATAGDQFVFRAR